MRGYPHTAATTGCKLCVSRGAASFVRYVLCICLATWTCVMSLSGGNASCHSYPFWDRSNSRHVGHDDMRQSSCRLDTQCRCDGAASLLDIPEGSPSAAGSPDCAFRLSASARTNSNVNECWCCCHVSCRIFPPPHDR